jgi:hypothetical protein
MATVLSYPRMRVSMPFKPWIPDQVGHDRVDGGAIKSGMTELMVVRSSLK